MNWRVIVCSLGLLAGCQGGGYAGAGFEPSDAVKISYFRSNYNQKMKKWEPTYRVVMSETWKDRVGEGPREPFGQAAPGRVYVGYLSDMEMQKYIKLIMSGEFGLHTLNPSDPATHRADDIHRRALNAPAAEYTRIITVGTEKWHKSYYYPDQQVSKQHIATFLKCEALVSRITEYSLQIKTGAQPAMPTDK